MKLIYIISPVSCYFMRRRSKYEYSPMRFPVKIPQFIFSPRYKRPLFTPISDVSKTVVFLHLMF